MQALSEYLKADKSSLISLNEKLVVNKNYVGEQLPEYMIVLTNPEKPAPFRTR